MLWIRLRNDFASQLRHPQVSKCCQRWQTQESKQDIPFMQPLYEDFVRYVRLKFKVWTWCLWYIEFRAILDRLITGVNRNLSLSYIATNKTRCVE